MDAGRDDGARTLSHTADEAHLEARQEQEAFGAEGGQEADSSRPGLRHHGPCQSRQDAAARPHRPNATSDRPASQKKPVFLEQHLDARYRVYIYTHTYIYIYIYTHIYICRERHTYI